jgi:uncharacterized protein YtpQ (UPF0354 family)
MNGQDLCSRALPYLVSRGSRERPVVSLPAPDALVLTDLGNGLLVGYVVDHGPHFQYIQRGHLWAAGMTRAELHLHAVARLATMLADKSGKIHACADGFVVVFDGYFDASLILVDVLWDETIADLAPNGFVVAIPNRNVLAFCDSRTPEGPEQLRRIIEDVGTGDHPLTKTLYHRDPARRDWRPYRDPGSILN